MKKLPLIAILAIGMLALQACNDGSTDAIRSANESNEIKQDSAGNTGASTTVTEKDS